MSLTKERQERKPHVKRQTLYQTAYIKYEADQRHLAKTSLVFPPGGSGAWKETFTLFLFPGPVLALGPLSHQASALALTFIPVLVLRPVLLVFRRAIHEPPGCHHSCNCLLGAQTRIPAVRAEAGSASFLSA